jgi:ABC-type transporter Mla MlaB component
MLRITSNHDVPTEILTLEGKLVEPWAAELRQECSDLLQRGRHVRLDLAAVLFVDSAGYDALRELMRRGVTIGACSSFVAELLKLDKTS